MRASRTHVSVYRLNRPPENEKRVMRKPERPRHIDMNKALLDPESVFATPEDVVAEPSLSRQQKAEILRIWAYDASESGVALEEGMPGAEDGMLQRILVALDGLSAHVDLSRTGSTKQHGIPQSAVTLDELEAALANTDFKETGVTSKTIQNLQTALEMEMTAVQQYLLHAHVLEDWGLDRMATRMREEMQEELGHAGRFIDRILFLGGEPHLKPAKTPKRAKELKELFASDLEEEKGAVAFYTNAAADAEAERDIGTRTLFEQAVLDEEGHMEWLSLQLDLLQRMGEPVYTARHMTAPGDT